MGIVCVLNLQLSSQIHQETKRLAESEELIHQVGQLDMLHDSIRGEVLFLMVFNDDGAQNRGREELTQNLKDFGRFQKGLQSSTLMGQELQDQIPDFQENLNEYQKISSKLGKKSDIINKSEYISQDEFSEFEKSYNGLKKDMVLAETLVMKTSKEIARQALDAIDHAKNLSILMFVLGGLVSSLVVVFMANTVTAPLNQIVHMMDRLAEGDLRAGGERSVKPPRTEPSPKKPPVKKKKPARRS